ncbi:hypothetical protein SADUNF_Sadunf15G0032500 [Salix dunnii]|uniref:Uncharacterized protein n=1 Tax=Salix dunnii TaxID=1413687 RepID=A0A835JCB9_9ROSI|nr:hypothetical protein SADUNF_Sadunf15G0032500 [Salix dunnii]
MVITIERASEGEKWKRETTTVIAKKRWIAIVWDGTDSPPISINTRGASSCAFCTWLNHLQQLSLNLLCICVVVLLMDAFIPYPLYFVFSLIVSVFHPWLVGGKLFIVIPPLIALRYLLSFRKDEVPHEQSAESFNFGVVQ